MTTEAGRTSGLSHRPDMVTGPWMVGPLGEDGALVEVAGRDSIAAAVALARDGGLRRMLPTVAFTGTEYGDLDALASNVERLRLLVGPLGVEVAEPVFLGSPHWWRATIGRANSVLARLYGPWHICIGCHMYLHAVRAPLAWRAGAVRQIGGERLQHKGNVKMNQTRPAVEAYRKVLAGSGITLELPLLELDDEETMLSLAGVWKEGEGQPDCVLAGNYRQLDGSVSYDEGAVRSYLEEFLVPATSRILATLREGRKADYDAIVAEVISRTITA